VAAQLSPVTSSVLRWAVEEDGRSAEVLAERLNVQVDVLISWLNGDSLPTKGQVTNLATTLKRPRAVFFLPAPPQRTALAPDFRHAPGDKRPISANVRTWVRRARRIQSVISWAASDKPAPMLPQATFQQTPSEAAGNVRKWLGVTGSQQASWPNDYAALRAWREALEAQDLLVFALELGAGEVRGFSAYDDHAPLIVTNTSRVTPAARIYTLSHELGHLVTRRDATCLEPDQDYLAASRIERWCEEFAANLLMPTSSVKEVALERRIADRTANLDDVRAITRAFRVSARAAARRLIDVGLADETLYRAVVLTFVPKPSKDGSSAHSPPVPEKRLREYGERTIRAVLGSLPPQDALPMLRLTVEQAREVAERVPGVAVP